MTWPHVSSLVSTLFHLMNKSNNKHQQDPEQRSESQQVERNETGPNVILYFVLCNGVSSLSHRMELMDTELLSGLQKERERIKKHEWDFNLLRDLYFT